MDPEKIPAAEESVRVAKVEREEDAMEDAVDWAL